MQKFNDLKNHNATLEEDVVKFKEKKNDATGTKGRKEKKEIKKNFL
mgnify:CR=1 FL=1